MKIKTTKNSGTKERFLYEHENDRIKPRIESISINRTNTAKNL